MQKKEKRSYSNHPIFQVRLLLVSGRVPGLNKSMFFQELLTKLAKTVFPNISPKILCFWWQESPPVFRNPQVTCTKKRAGLSSGSPSQTTRLNKEVYDLLDITWCGEFDQKKYLEARIMSAFPRCVGGKKQKKTPASNKPVTFPYPRDECNKTKLVSPLNSSLNQKQVGEWWLVGGFNPPEKYARQNGNPPQVGMKIKNVWNHHLDVFFR